MLNKHKFCRGSVSGYGNLFCQELKRRLSPKTKRRPLLDYKQEEEDSIRLQATVQGPKLPTSRVCTVVESMMN